jgi:hypothetical protein
MHNNALEGVGYSLAFHLVSHFPVLPISHILDMQCSGPMVRSLQGRHDAHSFQIPNPFHGKTIARAHSQQIELSPGWYVASFAPTRSAVKSEEGDRASKQQQKHVVHERLEAGDTCSGCNRQIVRLRTVATPTETVHSYARTAGWPPPPPINS